MSTEEHSNDPTDDAPTGASADGNMHPAEQDAAKRTTSDTAGAAAVTDASPGLGRSSVGPAQDEATLNLPERSGNDAAHDGHTRSLAEALDLLRASVDYLASKKRRTTAAAISLEMRRRSGNAFTPGAVGFGAFREFLRFAEGVGAVTLLPPVPGGDMEVLSAPIDGSDDTQKTPLPATATPKPIRRDLWQAFVDWSPQWQRAFDAQTGRVVTIPVDRNATGGTNASEEAAAWREDRDRFRRIVPLSPSDQLRWMQAFVSELPSGQERQQLSQALEEEHPLAAFARCIRMFPDAERSWRVKFTEEVTSAVTRWMRQERLTTDMYHMPSSPDAEPRRPTMTTGPKTESSAWAIAMVGYNAESPDDLRQQVLKAVSRMSLSELLRLPIPAEYLLLQ